MNSYKNEINQLIERLDSEVNFLDERCNAISTYKEDYDLNGLYSEVFLIYNRAKGLMDLIRSIQEIITPLTLEPVSMVSDSTQDSQG